MRRILSLIVCMAALCARSERLDALQVGSDGVLRTPVQILVLPGSLALPGTVSFGTASVGQAGLVMNGVTVGWPEATTNTLFATTAYVDGGLEDLRQVLSIAGRKDIYDDFTNAPPNTVSNLCEFVGRALEVLAYTSVQPEIGSLEDRISGLESDVDSGADTNRIESLELRASAAEERLDSIRSLGDGTDELDFVLAMDPESMNMVQMTEAFKAIARYIKYGSTNVVEETEEE